MTAPPAVESSIQQLRGAGQPLAEPIRQPLEEAFGADFGAVRAHTDTQADELNRSMQAKAFTIGQHIFFRQGEYRPACRDGQALLAHELTHVVQQHSSTLDAVIQRQTMEFHPLYKENFETEKDENGFDRNKSKRVWQKVNVTITPSDHFMTHHLRQSVDDDTAREALEARDNTDENTIFRRDQMRTAAAALEGSYYVKKEQIGKDVGVRVRDIEALRADRRFSSITVHALQTFSGWMKILGTLSKEGKITLHHVDQLVG